MAMLPLTTQMQDHFIGDPIPPWRASGVSGRLDHKFRARVTPEVLWFTGVLGEIRQGLWEGRSGLQSPLSAQSLEVFTLPLETHYRLIVGPQPCSA